MAKRRAFSLEFKSEAVRRLGERRLQGVTLAQAIASEIEVRVDAPPQLGAER